MAAKIPPERRLQERTVSRRHPINGNPPADIGGSMRTPANVAGHPIHPMLVTLPIGLWVFSFVCDLFFVFGSGAPAWSTVALYTMGGGIVGALIAAVPGLIDLLSLPAELRKTALAHMAINLSIVAISVVNFWLRLQTPAARRL